MMRFDNNASDLKYLHASTTRGGGPAAAVAQAAAAQDRWDTHGADRYPMAMCCLT